MAWHSHEYARAFGTGIHATPPVWDVGHENEPQTLLARLNASIPGEDLRVRCEGTALFVEIEGDDFTGGQLTTVVADIAAQKAVADWPQQPSHCGDSMMIPYAKPPAAEATTILAAVDDDGNSVPDAQPNYPSNVRCIAAGCDSGGSTDVTVIITGIRADGMPDTETIEIDAGDDDYDGVKGWASISDIAYSGAWVGAEITFKNGPLLGVPCGRCTSVYKEVFGGAPQTVGTFNSTYRTYEPTGGMDGAKPVEIWLTCM